MGVVDEKLDEHFDAAVILLEELMELPPHQNGNILENLKRMYVDGNRKLSLHTCTHLIDQIMIEQEIK